MNMRRFFLFLAGLAALLLLAPAAGPAAPLGPPANLPETPDGRSAADDLALILEDLGRQRGEVVVIQRELVSRPALGPEAGGEGEEAKAHWLLTWLTDLGLERVERIDSVDRTKSLDRDSKSRDVRPNLVARLAGRSGLEKGRTFWIVCHMHVAAPGPPELWHGSPWTLRVEGDTLFGRGVMDNYQSITAALLLFKSLVTNGVTPPMNLGLVLHSQNSGFRHLLETRPDLFKPDDLYLVPDFGEPSGATMGTAEKGLLWLKLTFTGQVGHAAAGRRAASALTVGSRFIVALPELTERFPAENPLFIEPVSTFTPTRAATNENGLNAVAAVYTVYVDSRFAPPQALDEVERGLRELAERTAEGTGVAVDSERLVAYEVPPVTPEDSPVVLAVRRAVAAQLPEAGEARAVGMDVVTAASFLRAAGRPAVAWAKIDPAKRQAANESAEIGDHLDEAKVMARILFDPEAAAGAAKP